MASFILPIISGLAGLFGGGQQKSTTSTQQQSGTSTSGTNTSGVTTGSTSPVLSDLQTKLSQLFGAGAQNLYNTSADLSGYTSKGLQDIAGQGTLNQKALSNTLAARGLSFSPAAATSLTQNQINTGNQQQQFLQQIPLLQRQLQQQSVSGLEGAFGALPTGTTSTGTTTGSSSTNNAFTGQGTSTGTQSGNPLAGLFGGLGAGLAAPGSGGSNISNILKLFGF